VDAETAGGRIEAVIADRPSTEDQFRITADVFVDCTGDGRLGAAAGAIYREGRESRNEYGEPLAPEKADAMRLGSSLLFMARRHDHPMPFIPPPWAREFTEKDLALRPHAVVGEDSGLEYGYWWVEWGGMRDTIRENEAIRDELLAVVYGVWDHIKNGGDHGAEYWALEWVGAVPGKRESRRFVGQSTLTETDVMESRAFCDAIAYGGWPIDIHPYEGIDAPDEEPCRQIPVPHLFDIPLGACVAGDVENLLFAGRNISATHVAFASTRVMATCAAIGQGVGTAAAYAIRRGQVPHGLPGDATAMTAIQQELLRNDAYLIGVTNRDPADVARSATASASSEQPGGEATNLLSGQTRSVHGPDGAPADRANPGTHRWTSDPALGLPAWIMLAWSSPRVVRRIELVFDTDMHRPLTLTQSDQYAARMRWGVAQEATVKDYVIEGRHQGQWAPLVTESGNYLRKCTHILDEAIEVDALRIIVEATHGVDHARIFEVRAYAE
jgi:hypothetical protein